ncbi:urea amidolyase-like protein [Myxococcus xanthus DK 1622]|uniref:Urea amidolyase-like protein n=1 Tax=Myxococcus xanthus (strain DK1622) TaxID=246197 RepID=Q1DC04_MYXXD|nr:MULTISPECIES: biotin-dependent carboxyltransferase family protein [Myxococcus]ABF86673.1 urea amidolyase-like protein [Myxococcus xanthus DK 1622]NOJ51850.1 biotin-dependent carboxyltransferase family protein [Myxococcus xanthus]QPM81198.1 biotin-dependent carboxyltransferase family protein [Myxococcus xanthus]QVW70257.1 biotin-dependent carboxyltransferase family protein [Myxococcus xanthus DZ2]QZZ49094.1 5-oxoprolinase subunit C [Myxococcus xanthus]
MTGWLDITGVGAPVTVQDAGRPGKMHHGVPPGGPLVPELLALANLAVGNASGTAALEAFGRLELRARGRSVRVSMGGHAFALADGERLTVPAPESTSVRYVAVDGGLAVPEVLGGRGTLLVARLGGHEGRLLRSGDSLPLGDTNERAEARAPGASLDAAAPIRVTLGPDNRRFGPATVATLLSGAFTVSAATDRVGMRLQGPSLTHGDEGTGTSRPMVRGAIQVTLSGTPIVLGPDHPTTGGYPLIATVIRADWGRLCARRPGAAVRFQEVSLEEAREAWRHHAEHFGVGGRPTPPP